MAMLTSLRFTFHSMTVGGYTRHRAGTITYDCNSFCWHRALYPSIAWSETYLKKSNYINDHNLNCAQDGRILLEQVFVESIRRRESREAIGHEDPAAAYGNIIIVLPGLIANLAIDFVSQLLIGDTSADNVVSQQNLSLATQIAVVNEAQNQLENDQRLLKISFVAFRQQWSLDRLLLGTPQVRLANTTWYGYIQTKPLYSIQPSTLK